MESGRGNDKTLTLHEKVTAVRKMSRIFTVMIIVSWSISGIFAQFGLSTSNVGATVVNPIVVTKSVVVNFDNVAVILAGSVELIPSSALKSSSNIVLPVTTGTFTAATFVVGGTTAYSYKITVPPAAVEVASGKDKYVVSKFESEMLITEPGALAGIFVSVSPMNVIVNYN